jgi:hypothetical protein
MIRWLLRLLRRKNPVYETMTRYATGKWIIRVWREEPEYHTGPDKEVLAILERTVWRGSTPEAITHYLGELPRVSAVEIVDSRGNGGLFYPDWK